MMVPLRRLQALGWRELRVSIVLHLLWMVGAVEGAGGGQSTITLLFRGLLPLDVTDRVLVEICS